MAEITQRLGFDASQAIAALKQLQTALGGVNRQLRAFNTATASLSGRQATQSLTQLQTSIQGVQQNLNNTPAAFNRAGQAGTKAATQITLSWETMLRVVQTQIIVRSLVALIDAFNESADAAEQFSIDVAQISNIADGPGSSIDELSNSLNDLSVQLGRPIGDVTTAAFEALQNDLGTTAETMKFLEGASQDLALVTGGELVDGVNAISSILKSYNLDISESDRVSDIFFGTIDAGRVTLEDLADSLGTIAPLGRQLSVELEELGASIAAITLQGVDASTAQTQLRGIFNALLKPTDSLQEAFAELGVTGGRDLIESTGGLIQALLALENVAAGNEQQFASFFGRIRGQLGALNILNDNASEATRILGELRTNAGAAGEAAGVIEDTLGRRAQVATEEFNAALRELGKTTAQIRTDFVVFVNDVIAGLRRLGPVFQAILVPFDLIAQGLSALIISFAEGVGVIFNFAESIGVTVAELLGLADVSQEGAQAHQQALADISEEAETVATSIAEQSEASAERQKSAFKLFAQSASNDYRQLLGVARQVSNDIANASTNAATRFGDSVEDIIDQIDETIDGISESIDELQEDASDTRQELEDFNFERAQRGLDDAAEAANRLQRSMQAINNLPSIASQVTADPETQEAFNESLERSIDLAKEALDAADASGDESRIQEAERNFRNALQQREQLQRAVAQRLSDFQSNLDERNVESQRRNLIELSQLATNLAEARAALQEAELSGDTGAEAAAQAQVDALEEEFVDTFGDLDLNLLDALGVDDAAVDAATSFANSIEKADVQWTNAVNALQEALDSRLFRAQVEFSQQIGSPLGDAGIDEQLDAAQDINDPTARLDAMVDAINEFNAAQLEAQNRAQQFGSVASQEANRVNQAIRQAFSQTGTIDGFIQAGVTGFTRLVDGAEAAQQQLAEVPVVALGQQLQAVSQQISAAGDAQAQAIGAQLITVRNAILQAQQQGDINSTQADTLLQGIEAARRQLEARLQQVAQQELIDPQAAENAAERLRQLNEIADTFELRFDTSQLNQGTDQLEESAAASENSLEGATEEATESARAIGKDIPLAASDANRSIGTIPGTMAQVTSATNVATTAMNQLTAAANAAAAAAAAANAAGGGFAYHGGKMNFRQAGGPLLSRGADTQLVGLAPGEIVLNQRASRNFAAQAFAMNAGQRPQFREEGGSVTNIGDVNVNVQADSTGGVDARQLGNTIRRELRRETLRLQ